jgi:hypothetical protein
MQRGWPPMKMFSALDESLLPGTGHHTIARASALQHFST